MDDTQHFDDVLFAFVLGSLSPAETTGIQVHLRDCRRCTQALRQVREDTAQLALALAPLPAPALIRESLLHSIGEIDRFYDWAAPVAEHLGCSTATARAWLDGVDEERLWQHGPDAGVMVLPLHADPSRQFIRLQAGTPLPHEEGQSPTLFVLQGVAEDSSGAFFRPGDIVRLRADEHAEITAAAGPDLICLCSQRAHHGATPTARHAAPTRAVSQAPARPAS
jgi:hypothetical protein